MNQRRSVWIYSTAATPHRTPKAAERPQIVACSPPSFSFWAQLVKGNSCFSSLTFGPNDFQQWTRRRERAAGPVGAGARETLRQQTLISLQRTGSLGGLPAGPDTASSGRTTMQEDSGLLGRRESMGDEDCHFGKFIAKDCPPVFHQRGGLHWFPRYRQKRSEMKRRFYIQPLGVFALVLYCGTSVRRS